MQQQYVDYLNLEYVLTRAYNLLAGFDYGSALPHWGVTLVQTLFVIGMFFSLVFLILIVYTQIKLLLVEHAGFHVTEAHEWHEEDTAPAPVGNTRFERIYELSAGTNESDWRRAILEADIMLGDALNAQGYTGASVGEQLKIVNPMQVTTVRLAWDAHMVRNSVAHGGEGYVLSQREVRTAIENYKRVLQELGAV